MAEAASVGHSENIGLHWRQSSSDGPQPARPSSSGTFGPRNEPSPLLSKFAHFAMFPATHFTTAQPHFRRNLRQSMALSRFTGLLSRFLHLSPCLPCTCLV